MTKFPIISQYHTKQIPGHTHTNKNKTPILQDDTGNLCLTRRPLDYIYATKS